MKNKKTPVSLILIIIIILLAGTANILYSILNQDEETQQLATQDIRKGDSGATEQKIEAPDFIVYDADGNAVQLSDYVGKPVVLNFWASWCSPCKNEMPDFNKKYLELGDEVQFLMINLTDGNTETISSASAFIAEKGYAFPVFYDTESDAASAYGVSSIPTTYFIDADGYAVAHAIGSISEDLLQKGIDIITK